MENGLMTLQPSNLAELGQVAELFVKSGFFQDATDVAKAAVKIMAGQELGVSPFAAMKGINIIEGKPEIAAHLLAAMIKRSGRYNYRVTESTDLAATIAFYEKSECVGESSFSIQDATRAGLNKRRRRRDGGEYDGPWQSYPKAMLYNRALSQGCRMYCPDLFLGPVYVEGELQDPIMEPEGANGPGHSDEFECARAFPENEKPASSRQLNAILGLLAKNGVREGDKRELRQHVYGDDPMLEAVSGDIEFMKSERCLTPLFFAGYVHILRERVNISKETVLEFLESQFQETKLQNLDGDQQCMVIDWLFTLAEPEPCGWQRVISRAINASGCTHEQAYDWVVQTWGDDKTVELGDIDESLAYGVLKYPNETIKSKIEAFILGNAESQSSA